VQWKISVERLIEGLESRSRAIARKPVPVERDTVWSIFKTFEAHRLADDIPADANVDRRWFAVFAASTANNLARQRQVLESVADPGDLAFTVAYGIGYLLTEPPADPGESEFSSSEDYSIIAESAAFAIPALRNLPDVRDALDRFIEGFPPGHADSQTAAILQLCGRFNFIAPTPASVSLAAFQNFLTELKRSSLHLVGPDVITFLQVLMDPAVRFERGQIDAGFSLLTRWGIAQPALLLLLPRLLGNYPVESEWVRERVERWDWSRDKTIGAVLRALLDPDAERPKAGALRSAYDSGMLAALLRLRSALARRSAHDAADAVAAVYAVDPALIFFLPWDRIIPIVQQIQMTTPAAAFTAMLTSGKAFQRAYHSVWLRLGKGALIASLTSMVPGDAKAELDATLFTRLRELPPPVASALTEAILAPDMFDRLIGATLAPRVLEGLLDQELTFSLLRIEALRMAEELKLVSRQFAEEQINHETDQTRLKTFETRMRSGRVHIPWATVRDGIETLLSGLPIELIAAQVQPAHDSTASARIVAYFGDNFARYVLREAGESINQALSNNLRHGFIVPRILRAFDDALQATTPAPRRTLPKWDLASLKPGFESPSRDPGPAQFIATELIAIRKWVDDTLREFQDQSLAVTPKGTLERRLSEAVAAVLDAHLNQETTSPEALQREIEATTETVVSEALRAASEQLTSEVRPLIMSRVHALKERMSTSAHHRAFNYLDSLEVCLSDAFEEVGEWIKIAPSVEELGPFKLHEVVKFELASMYYANWRNLKVEAVCLERGWPDDSLLIKGSYFQLFQDVIHNLLANAFNHSGLGLRTTVILQLDNSKESLILRCENTLARPKLATVLKRQSDIQERARRPLDATAAEDKLSGFLKIRRAYLSCFGRESTISSKIIQRPVPQFIAEVALDSPPEIWE
jgi:hypothetical protein